MSGFGVFPEGEEILISSLCLDVVAFEHGGARKAQVPARAERNSHSVQPRAGHHPNVACILD